MRKIYLLLFVLIFTETLTAQQTGGNISGWYNPEELLRNTQTGPFEKKAKIIFPDSSVFVIDTENKIDNVAFHAWGHLFDLRHVAWEAVSNRVFHQRDNYTWDSLSFGYVYRRNNPDITVVDTCFVTYYKNSMQNQFNTETKSVYCWTTGFDTMRYAKPKILNTNTLAGENYYRRDTILLTPKDTTTLPPLFPLFPFGEGNKRLILPVGIVVEGTNASSISVNPKSWFAATIAFKPGYNWSKGDTIESFGSDKPLNGGDYFGFLYHTIAPSMDGCFPGGLTSKNYTENSLILHKSTRYGQTITNGWGGFIPGNAANNAFGEPIYVDMQAFVSGTSTVSVKEVEDLGLSLGKVYPNPANGGQSIFIEYGVKNATDVTIEVYDIVGKKVATVLNNERVEAGDHKASVTLNLNPGVYFYTLSSGNTNVSSQKFTVIR